MPPKIVTPNGVPVQSMPEYGVWKAVKTRCYNPKALQYKDYGGRGIGMYECWRRSFLAFLADMGPRPIATDKSKKRQWTIERIDNSKGYEPGNCCWATYQEQRRNTRSTRYITFNGKTQCMKAWAEELGLNYSLLRSRLNSYGWGVEQALTTPTTKERSRTSQGRFRDERSRNGEVGTT